MSFTLNNQKRLIRGILLIFMLLLLPIITGCSVGTTGLNAGDIAPDFKLDGLDGKTYILSNFRGSPVLLNFWATWCGPCRAIGPLLEKLAKEHGAEVIVAKVNVDDCPALAQQFDITAIPTLLFFKEGTIVDTMRGLVGYDALVAKVQSLK